MILKRHLNLNLQPVFRPTSNNGRIRLSHFRKLIRLHGDGELDEGVGYTQEVDTRWVDVLIDGLGDTGVVEADLVDFKLGEAGDDEDGEGDDADAWGDQAYCKAGAHGI